MPGIILLVNATYNSQQRQPQLPAGVRLLAEAQSVGRGSTAAGYPVHTVVLSGLPATQVQAAPGHSD